jgi:hypothetical protein
VSAAVALAVASVALAVASVALAVASQPRAGAGWRGRAWQQARQAKAAHRLAACAGASGTRVTDQQDPCGWLGAGHGGMIEPSKALDTGRRYKAGLNC